MRLSAILSALALAAGSAAAQPLNPELARQAEQRYKNGVALMMAEKCDQAIEEFQGAVAIDKLMALAHYNIGQCRMWQRRYVEAVIAYTAARDAFQAQGSLSQQERNERERARQNEINDLKDSLARLKTIKNASAQEEFKLEERIRALDSMQNRNLQDENSVPAEVYLALGSAYFRQQKLAEAEREYLQAVRVNRKLGAAHNNLAVIYMLTGRLDEAEAAMKLAEKNGFTVNPQFKADLKAAKEKR
jgi:tetratricopeptide (TPR) repeat protein